MRRFDPFLPSHLYEPLAQLVEHLTFNQGVGGSSPSWLTIFIHYVPLAQLDRAFDYESKGREFESLRARHFRGYSSVGRAPALQAGGRRFESVYLHHVPR